MKKIFDYFLEQLNDNNDNLNYRGNFLFKFHTDSLKVYEPIEGKLVNKEIDYNPVSLITSESVPFVEDNERIDWLVEFGILTPISGQEFNEETDLDYANIARVCKLMNGKSVEVDNLKYAFKTTPRPKYLGWDFLGESKRAFLSVTINMTELLNGEFGQASKWFLDDVELDVVTPQVNMTRRFYTNDIKESDDNDFNTAIGRIKLVTLTINYNPNNNACKELFKETRSTALLKKTYILKEINVLDTFTNKMLVRSASDLTVRNSVRKLVIEFAEAVD